jgi:broad specificity phosphatase PhoE
MRIGLIRHFPVVHGLPRGWKTAGDLQRWREAYDGSAVTIGAAELGGVAWTACVSSDMPRARATAEAVFHGPVEQTALLREPDFATFATGELRLPVTVWRWMLLAAWVTGHRSQRVGRDDFRRRVQAAADLLETRTGDVLVVSHAGMITYLSRELRRRGFAGPRLRFPGHGVVAVFEK